MRTSEYPQDGAVRSATQCFKTEHIQYIEYYSEVMRSHVGVVPYGSMCVCMCACRLVKGGEGEQVLSKATAE